MHLVNWHRNSEFGIPASTNGGRFGYTGQSWLPELGMNYYKARMYSPTLGRFMQSDPIGYGDGMNMYNYVGSDPVNKVDPTGLATICYEVQSGDATFDVIFKVTAKIVKCTYVPDGPANGGSNLPPTPPSPPGPPGGVPQKEDCAYRNSSGMCVYTRDKNGKLQFTPEYQKQACANFAALQDGAAKTNDGLTTVGLAGGARGGLVGTIIGGLSTFGAFISSITTGAGYRPFGVTIIPKSAPPPGC